ncbi:hypothetical protein CF326_g896 [Tilletia indica]|nr:hypothetical protein CF326_g896 [Tilletia indica]
MSSAPTSITMKRKASDATDGNRPAPAERASQIASRKVWDNSEIVLEILSYLVRERIDLLVVSTVSKSLRVLALQLLVRHLDVPLTRAPACVHFFEANPKLCDSIKFVRVRDREAVRHIELSPSSLTQAPTSKTFKQPLPTYDSEQERDPRWFGFDRLLSVIQTHRTLQPLPLIDLTMGITGVSVLKATMRRFPEFAQRIAALRVISDLEDAQDGHRNLEDLQQLRQLAAARWRQLGLMVADMYQTGEHPSALRVFHADDATYQNVSNWYINGEAWASFKAVLPTTVEDLALRLKSEANHNQACILLEADWPRLRKFRLLSSVKDGPDSNRIQTILDRFLTRHQHLEEIWIGHWRDSNLLQLSQTFPNLKKCFMWTSGHAKLGPFFARHYHTVTDLEVSSDATDDENPNLFPPGIVANFEPDSLHVLRTWVEVAEAFVNRGARPRHLEMDKVWRLENLNLHTWLFSVSEAAEAVTCFDVVVNQYARGRSWDGASAVLEAKFLPASALPNLVELALSWEDYSTPQGQDASKNGTGIVRKALATLNHQTSLRALRLEHPHAPVFPPDTVIDLEGENAMPPQLEYLTWHSASVNVSQYFRIGRISIVHPQVLSDGSQEGSVGSVRKIRLERLPEIFRSRIDDNGVWHQSWRPRARNTLFDHSYSPPRLH